MAKAKPITRGEVIDAIQKMGFIPLVNCSPDESAGWSEWYIREGRYFVCCYTPYGACGANNCRLIRVSFATIARVRGKVKIDLA